MAYSQDSSNNKALISSIAKTYNSLQYTPQLVEWLTSLYPSRTFEDFNKYELHNCLNDALLESYNGEFRFKYSLFSKFKRCRLVAGFEMKVNKSRVDFVTIDEFTTSYEIKSTVDNLVKLSKQANDYVSAFEYNNVIIDRKHVDNCLAMLPATFGVLVLKGDKQTVVRRPMLNTRINSELQLQLLTLRELTTYFSCSDRAIIIRDIDSRKINENFKMAIKERYRKRWDFVVQHSNEILPIDLQFFFNTNISPATIYNKTVI